MAVYEFKRKDGARILTILRGDPMEWLDKQPDKDEFVSVTNASLAMTRFDLYNDFREFAEPPHPSLDVFMGNATASLKDNPSSEGAMK